MDSSNENGGGCGEEVEEEEVLPWSCVDETIRKELIIRLNPEHIMSGNNWRGLAGRLDYTTAQITSIESEKGNNTREFFKSYDLEEGSSFNAVYQALKDMDRRDCVNILDKYLPRIKRNRQKEKEEEARQLQQSMGTAPSPSCHYHHLQNHPHSLGVGGSCMMCNPHPSLHPPSMGSHHHSMCRMSTPHMAHHENCNNHLSNGSGAGSFPSSPCCHMGAMTHHPLQIPPAGAFIGASGAATCGNHSPTKACSHACYQQRQYTQSHLQMDISQSIPKCSAAYYYPSGPTTPSVVNHSIAAFNDQPHSNNSMISATSPTPYQYYGGVRDPAYSPKVSPESNNKPYNFTISGSCQPDMVLNSHQPTGEGRDGVDQKNDGTHRMGQPLHQNIVAYKACESDNHLSSNFSSQYSNENNASYPSSSSLPYYNGDENGDMSQLPVSPHHQHQNYPTGSNGVVGAAASASAKSMVDHNHHHRAIDSKKSLQKLTEISKMPDKYQPTKEYKTFVADQDVENKKQRSRTSKGSVNSSINSSSSGNSMSSTSSSSSRSGGTLIPKKHSHQEELPQMATLSVGNSPSVANNITDMTSNVYVTYSKDNEVHKKDVLRLTIFLNDNENSVWADVASDPAMAEGSTEPYQEYYALADFILICISPKYLHDISNPSPESVSLPIHTYEIHQMMVEEHQRWSAPSTTTTRQPSQQQRPKKRFISLLFGDMTADQVPSWLREYYPVYKWPQDYEHIGWVLKRPNEHISARSDGY